MSLRFVGVPDPKLLKLFWLLALESYPLFNSPSFKSLEIINQKLLQILLTKLAESCYLKDNNFENLLSNSAVLRDRLVLWYFGMLLFCECYWDLTYFMKCNPRLVCLTVSANFLHPRSISWCVLLTFSRSLTTHASMSFFFSSYVCCETL